jgi:hypothetical protein
MKRTCVTGSADSGHGASEAPQFSMGELIAGPGKRLKSYNKGDERVPMAKTTLADKLAKVVQRKAKAEQDEARLKDRQRVERTRQLDRAGRPDREGRHRWLAAQSAVCLLPSHRRGSQG